MMWIAEQPLTILLLTLGAEAALFAAMVQTGKKLFMPIMAGVALLGLLLLGIEWLVVTDREQVEGTLYDVADAIEANDVDRVIAHLEVGANETAGDARRYMGMLKVGQVKIKDNLEITIAPQTDGKLATASFNVTLIVSDTSQTFANQTFPQFLKVYFRHRDGVWRIYDYERFDPREGR